MKMQISNNLSIDPLRLVDSRVLITGNSGAGKSYFIRIIAEQAAGMVQTIILDHEGEFSTLREKFDFLLVGPGGEISAEVRSSSLLARKLLELQASAVVDMSAIKLPERRKFVRLFIESLMAAPKNLWHPLFLILDEAHIYCPERSSGDAESSSAVIDLMSMGRKRSFCGILATQRLSKLHKDAEAEANNVFIGRTWLDIDQKRACSLLGFGKEYHHTLRDMPAGKFFAFGPALSVQGVNEIQVSRCITTHPKPGHRHNFTPPKPSDAVRRLVKDLADLPQQADTEIRDLADAKKKIANLEMELRKSKVPVSAAPPVSKVDTKKEREDAFQQGVLKGAKDERRHIQQVVGKLVVQAEKEMKTVHNKLSGLPGNVEMSLTQIAAVVGMLEEVKSSPVVPVLHPLEFNTGHALPSRNGDFILRTAFKGTETGRFSAKEPPMSEPLREGETLPPGEKSILTVMAQFHGATTEQLTVMTGYKRSSRNTYLQRLRSRGFIMESAGKFFATKAGLEALGNYEKLPTGAELQQYWLNKLPEGEAKILKVLLKYYPNPVTTEMIDEETGYKRSSRNTYIQRMRAKNLFTEEGGGITASPNLFD